MDGTPSVPGTPTSGSNGGSMKEDHCHTPSSGRTAPPTLEELEAMEGAKDWKKAELESSTPGASNVSENSKHSSKRGLAQTFSRQVSRISGTGRPATALQHQPKQATAAMGMSTATPVILASIPARLDRTEEEPVGLKDGPRPRKNIERCSTTNFEESDDRRINAPTGAWETGPVSAPSRLAHSGNEKLTARKASSFLRGHSSKLLVAAKANERGPSHHQSPDLSSQRTQLESYSIRGAPTTTKRGETIKRSDHPHYPIVLTDDEGINGDREEGPALIDVNLKSPSKRIDGAGSDSDMDVDDVQVVEKTPTGGASSCGSPACWGGGLPPMRNAIAQGPPTARAAAARAPPATVRYPETRQPRYPSSDKESFARTLKDDELEELWQGLGEGVSQRGGGSEVAYEPPPAPTSPGTAASGVFPMLTANVLERHDQLAGDETRRSANVMPMPKGVGDKGLHGMENGGAQASSSKKQNRGSSDRKQYSLLGLITLYGVLVLWVAHLVFNVLLLRPVILNDHQYLWVLCLAPGLLGTLFSINSCYQNGHPKCKPTEDREEEEEDEEDCNTRSGPHACALPSYVVLLLLVVLALGMHASAMLFCEQAVEPIFFNESTLDPLCEEDSLLLPVVLDAVLLMVASLKASSLCWAWVLS